MRNGNLDIRLIMATLVLFSLLAFGCGTAQADKNLEMPERLSGVTIQYTYSGGNEYAVKFEGGGVSFRYLSGSSPDKWVGTFEYNHMMTESGDHLVSWHEPDRGDYVTLLINFGTKTVYGSAIVAAEHVHFQKAEISSITNP